MIEAALILPINEDGGILLQHKDKNHPTFPLRWCMFGGGVEAGEIPQVTIRRELEEELELSVSNLTYYRTQEDNEAKRHIFLTRTDRTAGSLLEKLHEGDNLGFFLPPEIDVLDIIKPHLEIIKNFIAKDYDRYIATT